MTRSTARDIAVVVGRDWKRLLRTPESLFFAAAMPVMFVLGLAAVFGDLVEGVVGQDYIQFLLPGVLVMQVTLAAGATGVGLATDLRDGIIDRFRSLPMAQIAVLTGRTTADLARNALGAAVMVAAGFAIGFRLGGGLPGGIAALGVALFFGYAATWMFAAAGLAVKDPQAANFIGFAPVLLFVYLSERVGSHRDDERHRAGLRPPPTRQRHDRSRSRPRQRNRQHRRHRRFHRLVDRPDRGLRVARRPAVPPRDRVMRFDSQCDLTMR